MWCGSLYIEILIALADGKGGVRSQQFMPQDLGQEDIVGHVLGLEAVAADCAVAAEVARFPGKVALAEGERHGLHIELRTAMPLVCGEGTDFRPPINASHQIPTHRFGENYASWERVNTVLPKWNQLALIKKLSHKRSHSISE